MRRWTIVNVLLALVLVLLGVQIMRTWARALPPVEVAPRAPAAETPPAPREKGRRGGADKGGMRGLAEPQALAAAIAEKELFDPSRKPPGEEAQVEPAKTTGPPPGVTVTGVRILGGDREVFLSETGGTTPQGQRRLRQGDEVAGYTVKAIEATEVTLASPSGDLVTMSLAVGKGKAGVIGPGGPVPSTVNQPPPATAAGARGGSPARGVVGGRPAVPGAPAARPVPAAGAHRRPPQLPPEVEKKLEQLKQRPGQ